MQFKSFMEALKGKQHKIDKNKNGQIDSHDFKLLRKEEQEEVSERYDPNRAALAKQRISNLRHAGRKVAGARIANLLRTAGIREESEVEDELIEQLDEVLSADAGADKWIHDFVHSTNPKFDGKSKKERINMALGAYYDTHKKKDGVSEQAPVAPTLDRKYIKGTPEHKAYKATKKPINGMPTNVKEEAEQIEELSTGTYNAYMKASKDHVDSHKQGSDTRYRYGKSAGPMQDRELNTKKAQKFAVKKLGVSEEAEALDEKSDQAKQNKTMKNMMDASRGARYKLNNPVPAAEPEHKTAQAHNKSIGRALRKEEESMKSFTSVMKESETIEEGRNEGDVPFDKPYKTVTTPTVKDKSGAVHTPMSRARDLARKAMNKQKPIVPVKEEKDEQEYGYEGDMAMNQLETVIRHATYLKDMMKPDTDLPEWVQSKITLATDYLQTACDYMSSEMNEEVSSTGPVNVKVQIAGKEPHEEKWTPAKKKTVKEEIDADGNVTYAPMTYNDFMMVLEYEADKGGRYVHKGSYGSEFAKSEREKDEKGFDAEPTKRGPKVGSKRGARTNLGNSKLHKTI